MTAPRRRWFQFSLATLFVAVTIIAIVLAWIAYSLSWISERRSILADEQKIVFYLPKAGNGRALVELSGGKCPLAPWPLLPFGEAGIYEIVFYSDSAEQTAAEARNLQRAFPEARIESVADASAASKIRKTKIVPDDWRYPN